MRVRFYARSDVGRKRPSNEDSFYTSDDDAFGIVCDGMGGHDGGEIASRLGVEVLTERLVAAAQKLKRGRKQTARPLARSVVLEGTAAANQEIYRRGGTDTPVQSRMGTTLVLFLLVEDFAVVAHVGDSRIYRVRGSSIERLTDDHSVIAASRSPREWGTAPRKRKFVTRALGTRPTVMPDIRFIEDLEDGDVFLLCSDGLSDAVRETEMATIVEKAGKNRIVALRSLVHLANKRGGKDNITVVLAEIVSDAPEVDPHGSTEELLVPAPARERTKSGRRPSARRPPSSRRVP
ncbi:serine/threonine-protein phosphatase [bacterium]|nr:serine/threonine-protein phosphatase [bacterium]